MKNFTNTRGIRVLPLILFFFSTIFFSENVHSQSIWNADAVGGTVNWNTASNWIGGVPDATKTVTIYNCTTCPRINTAGNQSKFVQVYAGGKLTIGTGGSLTIENPGGPGLKTHATSQVNVNQGGSLTIQNFWGEGLAVGGTFQNGGTININGGHTGIAVSAGASFTNNVNGTATVTGAYLNYGMTSSGTVLNNGTLHIDDANNDGISQYAGTVTNGVNGTLGITKTGVNGIFTKSTFNNNGTLNIVNGLNGIYNIFGNFNNNANGKLTVTGTVFLNTGIYVDPGTFKNSGELTIRHALSKGIEVSSGSTFDNFNKITLDVPAWSGVFNVGGSNFFNKPCALIVTNAPVVSYANFTNDGIIKSTSASTSSIGTNHGSVIGNFSLVSGNAPVPGNAIVWTGCSTSDWNDPKSWFPQVVPSSSYPKVYVQDVSQASGNSPVVMSSIVSPPLIVDQSGSLKIISGGTLSISDFMLGYAATAEIRQGANLTLQGGTFATTYLGVNGTVQNGGTLVINAPFHSVGGFSVNGGTVVNTGQINTSTGQYGAGVNIGLTAAVFTNSGTVSVGGLGGFSLNQSTLTNNAGGNIVLSGGQIKNLGGSTVTNNGSIAINRQATEGILCENSTFTNGGSIQLSFTNLVQNSGNFTNTGAIAITSPSDQGIVNSGTFASSGNIGISASSPYAGIYNGGSFTTGPGALTAISQSSLGLINWPGATFSNGGTLDITDVVNGNFFSRGLENQGTVVNQPTGEIFIRNTHKEGLFNFGTFTNNGQMTVENIPTEDGIATSSSFSNTVFGSINIRNTGNQGAGFWVVDGDFSNAGTLCIDGTALKGMDNWKGHTINQATGNIVIKNTGWWGLDNVNVFENYGNISIDGTGWAGLHNGNWKYDNRPGSTLTISNANGPGIETSDGFFNTGSINVSNCLSSIKIEPSGYFNNHSCADVSVDGQVDNRNVLNNEGFFKTSFAGTNTGPGTLNNNGLVEDFYGSFNGISFNNIAIRVRPIFGQVGGFIQNALEVGYNSPFQIGTTWYQDAGLTIPAGTYNPGVNTFVPTVGIGTHTLYFTANDMVNNCSKTVSIQVAISSPMLGFGNDESRITLYNYPNPFSDHTILNLSLPFDSFGKLVVYDNFGRLVEELYEGDFLKDELYQFDFDASDKRISSYLAVLVLQNGRTYPIRLIKADN